VRELDPLSHPSDLASTLVRAGRFDVAIHEAKRSLDFNTTYPRPHSVLGWAYFFVGKIDEGLEQLERAVALAPGDSLHLGQLGEAYGLAGRTDKAREQLRKLEEMARVQYVSPYHLAYVHTALGEYDTAVEYLERAFYDRAGGIYGIKGSYLFAPLRGHPRFTALLRQMNLG
jgi:adenylate cyclase